MSKTIKGKEYLTVKEFAAAANISDKAVYQQIKSRLEPYVFKFENQKYIEKAALEIFYSSNSSQVDTQVSSRNSSQVETRILDILEKQLENKDKQIEELQKQLEAAESIRTEMSRQIIELSSNIAEMANKAQYITAANETNKLLDKQQEEPTKEEIIEQQPKKSLWDRIRGK